MLAEKQVREEPDHARLLDIVEITFGQGFHSQRLAGCVHDVIDSWSDVLEQGDDVGFKRWSIDEVAWVARDLGASGWVCLLEL